MRDLDPRADAVRVLRSYPDIQPSTLHAGQVVLYPGHYPLGVWIVTAGVLRTLGGGPEGAARLDAADGPFVLPALAELDRPTARGAVVERDAETLFVPHSVARGDAAVRRLLDEARFPSLPVASEAREVR